MPSESGWPYSDIDLEAIDLDNVVDEDLLSLQLAEPRLLGGLEPLERAVLTARFGLDGSPVRTMRQIGAELGVSRDALRTAMGSGLSKLRAQLAD